MKGSKMRMRTCSIVLLVLCMFAPAMADVAAFFGDQLAGVEVGQRFGQVEIGGVAAFDYLFESSNTGDIDIDVQDEYVGPFVRYHFTRAGIPIEPFIGVGWLVREFKIKDDYIPLQVGANVKVAGNLSLGIAYVYCAEARRDDTLLFRLTPWQF